MSAAGSALGAHEWAAPRLGVEFELRMARRVLEETASADIYDLEDMIRSTVGLRIRLGSLVAALDAERGETQ